MKKKQRLPDVFLRTYIEEFPLCCGIGVLCGFEWDGNNEVDDEGYVDKDLRKYYDHDWGGSVIMMDKVPQAVFNTAFETATQRCKDEGYKTYMCSITDEDKVLFKKMDIALRKNGWKELTTTKSNHGKYLIHVYERKFARKRKNAKS